MNGDPGLMHLIMLAELLERHLARVLYVLSLVQSSPLSCIQEQCSEKESSSVPLHKGFPTATRGALFRSS